MIKYKYSIVIPCYNSQDTIVRCIESCISQSFLNFGIVIVDDCSDDDSCSIVESYILNKNLDFKIKLIKLDVNKGPANARNVGIEASDADYIALLDSDDLFYMDKLSVIDNVLTKEPEIDLIGHDYSVNEYIYSKTDESIKSITLCSLLLRNFAVTPSIVFKRSMVTRFDERMCYTEDHDFYLRAKCSGYVIKYLKRPLVVLDRPVLSPGGLSSSKLKMRLGEMRMLTNFCFRRIKYLPLLPLLISFSMFKHLIGFFK